MQVDFTVAGSVRRFDPLVETVLFRVAQEALTNVVRHSGTNQARVEIHFESGGICLRVADAGAGFDPTAVFHPPHGWGIAGMRERVESVGGKLQIESAPGDGTLVEACIPVSEVVLGEMEGNDGTDQVNAG
jgi:two-component system NarL family sensor kinase